MLIINTPQRPNGMIVGQLEEIAGDLRRARRDRADRRDLQPHGLRRRPSTGRSPPWTGMADRSILVDTFSKTYIMTGFRIGWCVANKDLITAMDIFQQNSVTNVPAFVQLAALAAITGPQDHVARDHRPPAGQARQGGRRAQHDAGHRVPDPRRLVLRLPRHPRHGHDRPAVRRLPHRAATRWAWWPASAFGDRGEGHIRLTYAAPTRCSRRAWTGSGRGWRTSRLARAATETGRPDVAEERLLWEDLTEGDVAVSVGPHHHRDRRGELLPACPGTSTGSTSTPWPPRSRSSASASPTACSWRRSPPASRSVRWSPRSPPPPSWASREWQFRGAVFFGDTIRVKRTIGEKTEHKNPAQGFVDLRGRGRSTRTTRSSRRASGTC